MPVQDYLNNIKKNIREITVEDVKKKIDQKADFLLIDVREKEEIVGGLLPKAQAIVRGFLELKIESFSIYDTKND